MSAYDRQLIDNANKLDYADWWMAYDMSKVAESETAAETLRKIAIRLYHEEEYRNGNL